MNKQFIFPPPSGASDFNERSQLACVTSDLGLDTTKAVIHSRSTSHAKAIPEKEIAIQKTPDDEHINRWRHDCLGRLNLRARSPQRAVLIWGSVRGQYLEGFAPAAPKAC